MYLHLCSWLTSNQLLPLASRATGKTGASISRGRSLCYTTAVSSLYHITLVQWIHFLILDITCNDSSSTAIMSTRVASRSVLLQEDVFRGLLIPKTVSKMSLTTCVFSTGGFPSNTKTGFIPCSRKVSVRKKRPVRGLQRRNKRTFDTILIVVEIVSEISIQLYCCSFWLCQIAWFYKGISNICAHMQIIYLDIHRQHKVKPQDAHIKSTHKQPKQWCEHFKQSDCRAVILDCLAAWKEFIILNKLGWKWGININDVLVHITKDLLSQVIQELTFVKESQHGTGSWQQTYPVRLLFLWGVTQHHQHHKHLNVVKHFPSIMSTN